MAINNTFKKKNGIYYTPNDLAEFLVRPFIRKNIKIFDPAYGKGSLLLAAERVHIKKYGVKTNSLFGCDINPKNGYLKHLPDRNFIKANFFSLKTSHKYHLIVLNPPFVRHHLISTKKNKLYKNATADLINVNSLSDLWVYFLLKSLKNLLPNGNIAAILPWSFLQADYSIELRKYLVQKFKNIKVLALGSDYFDKANERIVMLWLEGFGVETENIEVSFAKHICNVLSYKEITKEDWISNKINISSKYDISKIISSFSDYNFKSFDEIARVRIGVVTGADVFFIINNEDLLIKKIKTRNTIPILTSSKELNNLVSENIIPSKRLLKINETNKKNYLDYIIQGELNKYNERAHSKLRDVWFMVDSGVIPDGFFPYRVSKVPFLVLNNKNYQCTNSIHRVYFKNRIEDSIKKSIQLSFLTYISQVSIEINSKIYGSGVLKIEPSSLYKTLIYPFEINDLDKIYLKVQNLLQSNKKEKAIEIVSSFIYEQLKVPKGLREASKEIYMELQERRSNRI